MAYEERRESISRDAAGDLSAAQYKFVKLNSSNQVAVNTVSGGDVLGVLQNKPGRQGEASTVTTGGTSKIVAGATFAAGDNLMSDTQGRAILATSTNKILGTAMEAGVLNSITSINIDKAGTF